MNLLKRILCQQPPFLIALICFLCFSRDLLISSLWAQENTQSLMRYAQGLGYTDVEKLKEDYQEFSKRVRAGFAPKDYFSICRKTFEQSLCDALKEHLDPLPTSREKRPTPALKQIPFQVKNLSKLQAQPIRQLLRAFPDFTKAKIKTWAGEALQNGACPKNLNLAMALELEEKAPDLEDWEQIDRLWTSGLACVSPQDPYAEYMFFRAGISQFARGNIKAALGHFESALKSETRAETYRIRYWKYQAHKALGDKEAAKQEATVIGQDFPLSWYWLNVAQDQNIDPLSGLLKRPLLADVEVATDPSTNLLFLWTKVASELEPDPSQLRIFFEKVALKIVAEKNVGLSQHAASIFHKMRLYRLQILVLSQVVLNEPKALNKHHLDLLFPRPYFENMKQHSGEIDTAILLGVARQESGFDTFARSSANAHGVLQILHSTARGINRRIQRNQLYDYDLNISLGAQYILRLLKRFDMSMEQSLGAYNAGSTHMLRWRERYNWVKDPQLFVDFIPFKETRDYIPSILRNAYWYHRLYPSLNETENRKIISGQLLEPLIQKAQAK